MVSQAFSPPLRRHSMSVAGVRGKQTIKSESRIMIVEGHPVFRKGIAQFLRELDREIQLVEASSGKEALKQIQDSDFDLILLNVTQPDLEGSEVLKEINKKKPEFPILVYSICSQIRLAIHCIRLGARGYIEMEKGSDELLDAVSRLLDKEPYCTPSLTTWVVNEYFTDLHKAKHDALSGREQQVMFMIAEGKPIKEIAHRLGVSNKSVSTYRTRALYKMNMKTNADFIRYAQSNGLIDSPVSG